MKKRIAIVEDDNDLREALCMMIQFTDQYELAGSFENAENAIKLLPKIIHVKIIDTSFKY